MKKVSVLIVIIVVLCTTMASAASAAQSNIQRVGKADIEVLIDGRKISFPDARPFADANNRVLIPIRFIAEGLGAKVDWVGGGAQTVKISLGDKFIQLTVGHAKALVNNAEKTFDTKAITKSDRTFVPLRFVSEALGQPVEWDSVSSWVWVGEKKIYTPEELGLEPESIEKYEELYRGRDHLLKDMYGQNFETFQVITKDQLPIKIGDVVIYDIWLAKDNKNNLGVQIRRAKPSFNIYYVTNNSKPRYRNAINKSLEVKHNDETITSDYKLKSQVDELDINDQYYNDFKVSDIEYICFRLDFNSIVALKNPF
ncbi:copper amine oxidase N-terminal domain-containing protein [Paenibacillus sp. MSJ-34]|uniref:copper amine oxidase N-terminal domain-containing protein n=1 Tax=Paenibacillus sp. MSJ-34 TaxID=2841529 RepID=UPI001C114E46|nr:copper amine oxidase N-terminal domain-containing protein [Paenibacillus sp. MSJ-34]MBU5445459.1 copper amine oxidase N-terminal domain-containing protein [Paenibacillus sp. MSJ-34]